MHARYTDVFNVFLSIPFPGVDRCEASSDTGCELVTGQSWNNGCYGHIQMVVVVVDSGHRTQGYIAQWLERLTADQQVPGSIPGGGHGLSS